MLSPHKDKELELMLAGVKRAAMFSIIHNNTYAEEIRRGFAPYVAEGAIVEKVVCFDGENVNCLLYALPGHVWRLDLLEQVVTEFANSRRGWLSAFPMESIDRMLGSLLDYEQADIDHFVAHSQRKR